MNWWETMDMKSYERWLILQPMAVRDLLTEYPFGTLLRYQGFERVVVGATPDDMLLVTPTYTINYDHGMQNARHLCAAHIRAGDVQVVRALQ